MSQDIIKAQSKLQAVFAIPLATQIVQGAPPVRSLEVKLVIHTWLCVCVCVCFRIKMGMKELKTPSPWTDF